MGAPAVDAEAMREIFLRRSLARQRPCERQCVVKDERVYAVLARGQALEYGDVEVLAVVGDEDVGADEGSELREDRAERRGRGDVGIGVAVHRRSTR